MTKEPINAEVSSGASHNDEVVVYIEVQPNGPYRVTWTSETTRPTISTSAEGYSSAVVPDSAIHSTASNTTGFSIQPQIVYLHKNGHQSAPQAVSLGEIALADAKKNGMQETLRNYIHHNSVIADICVYEQAWIPQASLPDGRMTKGRLIQRAVVTHVHCGSFKIGDRIEYSHEIEDAPSNREQFRASVPGKLRVFFYAPDGSETVEDGTLKIVGDKHWGFDRVDDGFSELFALELATNPKLKK